MRSENKAVSGLIAILLATLVGNIAQAETLVSYSFDDENIESGPDTFQIFERSRGTAKLSSEFRYSGYYSVELRDVARDGDFPELQGYFPVLDSGTLRIHFAFMTPEPIEPFNIALAGPGWFQLQRDGIGFWLTNRDGYFNHVSDSIPRRLLPIRPFTWYLIDIDYRIDTGTYDLRIREEYTEAPQVELKNAPNATHSAGSRVSVFSFIGDLPDESNTVFYIDDIEVSSDVSTNTGDLLAPGRRKLFIDYWRDLQQQNRKRPECLPMRSFTDLGLDNDTLLRLHDSGDMQTLLAVLQASQVEPEWIERLANLPAVQAAAHWRRGCLLLQRQDAGEAQQHFKLADSLMPAARLYSLSTALAQAASGDFNAADAGIASAYALWYGDERFAAAQAMIGLAREDHWTAESMLREAANDLSGVVPAPLLELWQGGLSDELLSMLRDNYPDTWRSHLRSRLITEQYYFLLLWRDDYYEAQDFARRIGKVLDQHGLPAGMWHEFQGNAAFLSGDYSAALLAYQNALNSGYDKPQSVYLKLSDVFFRLADYENERYYRELVYGSLLEQEQP